MNAYRMVVNRYLKTEIQDDGTCWQDAQFVEYHESLEQIAQRVKDLCPVEDNERIDDIKIESIWIRDKEDK
jgi:hypothetical protein